MKPGVVPSVFPWVRTSPRKRKAPTERDFDASASRSAVRNLDIPGLVVSEVAASEVSSIVSDVESNIGSKTQDAEIQTELTDHEVYLTEIINDLKQEINKLNCQLQDMQRQNEDLNKRLFMIENLKTKDSSAAFNSGFPNWDTFMAVYTYLDPGERGENISYWRSSNADIFADYTNGIRRKRYKRKRGELDL